MANFYLPLSPRTHEKVPRCLLCSPITQRPTHDALQQPLGVNFRSA
jgi:hypothetical protein